MRAIALVWLSGLAGLWVGCSGSDGPAETDTGVVDAAHDGTADGADAADAPADSGVACGPKTCAAGEICTRTYTSGGACMPCGDGGACPTGKRCSGACCVDETPTYEYACAPKPGACTSLTCDGACGAALCARGGCPCETAAGGVATCHCLAP